MRVALLQLDPKIGQGAQNREKADKIIAGISPHEIELLVLPELAFTGYNFPDLQSIKPYLEPTTAGPSTIWAIATAQRLHCHVIVGYPEVSSDVDEAGNHVNYNSTVTISPAGDVVATYRKSFLYYTDESWAAEGSGFYCGTIGTLGTIAHGICMDINPKEFTAPWTAYEFANHCLTSQAKLTVLSTAWLTHTPIEVVMKQPLEPDISTLSYWIERFSPLLTRSEDEEHIVVFANRCGSEPHEISMITAKNGSIIEFKESSATYAGSSCVLKFGKDGIAVLDLLGQGQEGVLLVDTTQSPRYMLTRRLQDEDDSIDDQM